MTLELRPYQLDALAAIESAAARGTRRQAVVMPTGTGKTVVFVEDLKRRRGRALVLVHRDELVRQTLDKLAMAGIEHPGVVKAEQNDVGAAVIVASVQTVSRPNRLAALGPDFSTVVVDEAHHATAESYRRVLEHVGAFRDDGPLLTGWTATLERADGAALGDVFQKIVYEAKLLDMMRQGYLSDLRALQVHVAAEFNALHTRAGDFVESEAEAMLLAANAPATVARAYQEHAPGRRAIVFTPTVRVAHEMAKHFEDVGVPAEAVDAGTPLELRHELLARFHRGETRVVANCGVLTEGYDEPAVNCIVIARPTKSRPLYIQMVGRGTRRYPGKSDCLIVDVVGATTRHDLMTTATLFGIEPVGAIEQSVLDAVDTAQQAAEQQAAAGRLVAQAVELFRARPLNWVAAGAGRFALAIGAGGMLLLTATRDGQWVVNQFTRDRRVVRLQTGLDLAYSQGWAEDYARRLGAGVLIARDASWRRQAVSPKQLETGRRCRVAIRPDMTKGEAADVLTAHFARRW